MTVGDVNGDGRQDIVVGYLSAVGSVFFNTSNGTAFREIPWNDGKGEVYEIGIGDVDQDGWPDIVAARSGAASGIWFNMK